MAKHVQFSRDFDHSPKPTVDIAYKAEFSGLVPDSHADAAIAAGAGTLMEETAHAGEKPRTAEAQAGGAADAA